MIEDQLEQRVPGLAGRCGRACFAARVMQEPVRDDSAIRREQTNGH